MFPLTSFAHWKDRFNDVAKWQPYGGPGGFNDYDSIEVGNGTANSGMSLAAEQTQLSLWALGSAPLILGSDLTSAVTNAYGTSSGLDPTDLRMLTNANMIAIDEDAIDASRIYDVGSEQVFAKTERSGDGVVGLFDTGTNLSAANDTITTTPSAIGVTSSPHGYLLQNVWTRQTSFLAPTASITASVPSEGVALYRVIPLAL